MAITIEFVARAEQHSQYDWVDMSCGGVRVGKARCRRDVPEASGKTVFTIYSVNIYPEWAGHGYGREFVDYCKSHYEIVIADRVRQTAIGFWEAVGFRDNGDGNWVYRRDNEVRARADVEGKTMEETLCHSAGVGQEC
jgi:GNAT superfamily N-acetyltransferase